MKTMNNQVTRLRDEISGKEQALAKDQQEHKRLEKDNEALKVLLRPASVRVKGGSLSQVWKFQGEKMSYLVMKNNKRYQLQLETVLVDVVETQQ